MFRYTVLYPNKWSVLMEKKNEMASQIVVNYIQSKISSGEWKKKEKIESEPQLMKNTGVGRPAVREAIQIMVALGILTKRQGDGTYLNESSASSMMSSLLPSILFDNYDALTILQFREIVEPQCVKLFIDNCSDSDIVELRRLWEIQKENDGKDSKKFYEADASFHLQIIKGANNPLISTIIDILKDAMFSYQYKSNHTIGSKTGAVEHERILLAIEAKDKQLSEIYLRRHLERSIRDIKEYIKQNNLEKL